MDKQLLKAYIKVIVEEEVKRLLPELLGEAVKEIKGARPTAPVASPAARPGGIDRTRLAELMGLEYDGDTIRAFGQHADTGMDGMPVAPPRPVTADPTVNAAINRNYSDLMKKMGVV